MTTQKSIESGLRFWTEKIDTIYRTTEWIKCPNCKEEWSKLRPCRTKDLSGITTETHVCVVCAETLKGFDFAVQCKPVAPPVSTWESSWFQVNGYWPKGIKKDFSFRYTDPDSGEEINDIANNWKLFRVFVECFKEGRNRFRLDNGMWFFHKPAFSILLATEGDKIVAYDADKREFICSYETVFFAWDDVRQRICEWGAKVHEAEQKIKESWGDPTKILKRRI